MRNLLLAALLALATASHAQTPASTLPVDSASQKVTFSGIIATPGATADDLFSRAKAYALGGVVPPIVEDGQRSVLSVWERSVVSGGRTRILRYTARVACKDGRYRYELTDLENKTIAVQYKSPTTGLLTTVPGQQSPIERVLANPDGYKKGQPKPELLAYQNAVRSAIEQSVSELQRGMKGASKTDF